jgi:hypothetical protein
VGIALRHLSRLCVTSSPVRSAQVLLVALLLASDGHRMGSQTGAPAPQVAGLPASLEKLEYQPTQKRGGFSAPNRAQGLRLTFTEEGLSVEEREGGAPLVALGLRAFGRVGAEKAVGKAPARPSGAYRVERSWEGMTEWFLNQREGVEHGWTVKERAAGKGPFVLSVAVDGATAMASNNEALFVAESGRVLRYGSLNAFDAAGTALPAHMSASAEGLRIEVDDSAAHYPIVIDPLLTGSTWSAESNQTNANFGSSVASAGDVNGDGYSDVLIGAPWFDNGEMDEGRAFLYLGTATGLGPMPAWTAESDQGGAQFGRSVASAGDVNGDGYSDVVVGAPSFSNGEMSEGRAFLFLGGVTGLGATPVWTAESNQAGASFGRVASAGDVNGDGYSDVVVGASTFFNGEIAEGRAFLFLGNASGLASTPAWTAESNQPSAYFGSNLASAGDVNGDGYSDVVVGAFNFSNGEFSEGRAFLYLGSASGLSPTPSWTAESDQANSNFGVVSSAGDVNGDGYSDVVVGARNYDNGENDEGRAFLYLGSSSSLELTPAWTAESNQANASFGGSVASAGDVNGDGYSDVVVGGFYFSNGETGEGRAFLYVGSSSGLAPTPVWTAESNQTNAFLGSSVASAGDVNGDGFSDVAVGAPYFTNGQTDEGRAFVYLGSASGPSFALVWAAESNQADSQFGRVVSAGDVNGDGFSDVVVGAARFDNGETDEGRVVLYLGSASGLSLAPAWTAEGNQMGAQLGYSVASAGDVNGDGYSDVVVAAPFFSNGEASEGRVFLYLGSPTGLSSGPAWTAEVNQANAWFGYSVASAGDVNGDGFSDVVVGAPVMNNGRVFLYLGSTRGLALTESWTAEINQSSLFGASVASSGDVNGDGYSDVVVGANFFVNGQSGEGGVFVYLGNPSGLGVTPAWTAEGNQAGAQFGQSVASAGDVNADGYADLLVGSQSSNPEAKEGRAFLFLGSSTGLAAIPAWTAEGNQTNAFFGDAVASAGDVNGDGFSDVVVGGGRFDNGEADEGRAFLYLGSASGLTPTPAWTAESDQASSDFGGAASSAGDVNGDGFSDVVVGALSFDNGEPDEGRAFLYLGGDGAPGLPRGLAQQLSGSIPSGPIARGAAPVTLSGLGLNGLATQGRVVLETEVKLVGERFNGSTLVRSPWGLARQRQAARWTTVAPGRYHWRARVVSGQDRGRWHSYGGNSEAEADFVIVTILADGGVLDAGEVDAGVLDAGEVDAGALDAGSTDSGILDAGVSDLQEPDAGQPRSSGASYAVGCDCSAVSGSQMYLLLILLVCRSNARRIRGFHVD